MKKKIKKKSRKKTQKLRPKKKVRRNTSKRRIGKKRVKKTRKTRKTRKKQQPLDRLKAIKLPKIKIKKIKIPKIKFKKRKDFSIKKQLGQLTTKLINTALFPLFKAYDSYKSSQLKKKLKQEGERLKEQEREKKERARLIKEQKEKELRDQIKFAKETKVELQVYLRRAEKEARKIKAEQHKKMLINLRLEKTLQQYELRSLREQQQLEKYALQNLKEDYQPILDKIAAIKTRYDNLKIEKMRSRLSELGAELTGDEDKAKLLEAERELIFEKSKIESAMLPFTRSLRTAAFIINRDHLSKNMSPLKIIDNSMENGEVFIKWMELEDSEDFLILIYCDSLKSGKIVCELKLNPEKHTTHEFLFKEIFSFQERIIDELIAMLERTRNQKKAS